MIKLFSRFRKSKSANNTQKNVEESNCDNRRSFNLFYQLSSKVVRSNRSNSICQSIINQRKLNELNLDELIQIRVLGQGSFGKVILVRHRENNKLFAMKVMKKINFKKPEHIDRVNIERYILASINHPSIPKLHNAFQTNEKIYLIMDFCPGGELFFHLSRFQRFPERIVSFIAAEIILALEVIHAQGYIYRDLKPENILFDEQGHIKICDFGLARREIKSFSHGAFSVCGTPEYMAPEMIKKTGYGFCVDFWALGIIIYELLSGYHPWNSTDHRELFHQVKTVPLKFSPKISNFGRSLISGLLSKNIELRTGSNGYGPIKSHQFFQHIDWNGLKFRTITPPFNPCDGHNFNTCGDNNIRTDNFDSTFTRLPILSESEMENQTNETPIILSEIVSNPINFQGFKFLNSNKLLTRGISLSNIPANIII